MILNIGDVVKIIDMKNEPQYNGTIGIVISIDSKNQIHGTWGGCALLESDNFVIIQNIRLSDVNDIEN